MLKTLSIIAALVLVVHGLIHLLGTAAYLRLAVVDGLPYKTSLLAGVWEVGENGMRFYAALWAVAAIGFLAAAAAWLLGLSGWPTGLLLATVLSLALTGLDYDVAFMGVAVNVAILAALVIAPRVLPGTVPV